MPVIALLTCFFFGYIIKPQSLIDEIEVSGKMKAKRMFAVIIRYIAPICIVLILISSILDTLGIVKL